MECGAQADHLEQGPPHYRPALRACAGASPRAEQHRPIKSSGLDAAKRLRVPAGHEHRRHNCRHGTNGCALWPQDTCIVKSH
jgi:hypothetical protein